MEAVDVILLSNLQAMEAVQAARAALTPRPLLVGTINAGWPRRAERIGPLLDACDALLFVNRDYHLQAGSRPRTHWISHGVDRTLFRPRQGAKPARVLSIGSANHAEPKGFHDVLKPLARQLESRGIVTDFRLVDSRNPPFGHAEMADWYHSGSGRRPVASRSEGTPNPALEAAASGLVVVSSPVGIVPELIEDRINGVLVRELTVAAFTEGVEFAIAHQSRLVHAMQQGLEAWDWRNRALEYFHYFDQLLAE